MLRVWDASAGDEILAIRGHSITISSLAFSPDGKRIVSACRYDKTLKVWDVSTAQDTLTIKAHPTESLSLAFGPDGKRIVSGNLDGTLRVWDASTGEERLAIKGHRGGVVGSVFSVAFSPDGKWIVSGSRDNTLKVWDASTGEQIMTMKGHTSSVSCVAVSPDGGRVVSGGTDHTLRVWNTSTGDETLRKDASRISSVAFSPDGKRIVSGSEDNTLKLWDACSGNEIFTINGHSGPVYSVAFGPNGKRIASGSRDKTLRVWDASTGKEILTLKGHTNSVYRVVFSPSGKRVVSGSLDGTLKLWDASTGEETLTVKGHPTGVLSLAFSPDGRRIVSGDGLGTLRVWGGSFGIRERLARENPTVTKGQPEVKQTYNSVEILHLETQLKERLPGAKRLAGRCSKSSWSPDGTRIVFGKLPYGNGVQILNLETGEITELTESGKDPAWSPKDGRLIAYVRGDGSSEEIWLVESTGQNARKIADGGFPSWSGDGRMLYFHSRKERKIRAVKPESQDLESTDVLYAITSFWPAVSPDGKRAAYVSIDIDRDIIVVDLRTGERTKTWSIPGGGFALLTWSPDGRKIGVGSYMRAKQLGLWILNLESGKVVKVAEGPYTLPAWSRDGSRLSFDCRPSGAGYSNYGIWMVETKVLDSLTAVALPEATPLESPPSPLDE